MQTATNLEPISSIRPSAGQDFRRAQLSKVLEDLRVFTEENSREAFRKAFEDAQRALEASDEELRLLLRVSRPTIGRWARGDSAPHRFGRKPVLECLAGEVAKKLKTYR